MKASVRWIGDGEKVTGGDNKINGANAKVNCDQRNTEDGNKRVNGNKG